MAASELIIGTKDNVSIDAHPVGGFFLPPVAGRPVTESEVPSALQGPHIPVPSVTTSSTAVSQPRNFACHVAPEINFEPIPPYLGQGKCIHRELQEAHPYSAPRKHTQTFISSPQERYEVPTFNATHFPHRACPPHPLQTEIDPKEGDWHHMMHPDGSLYFHKISQDSDGSYGIFTDAYLYSESMLAEVTLFARYIWQHARFAIKSGDYDVVINVEPDVAIDRIIWSYYLVDHVNRMPIWMRPYNPSSSMRTTERLGVSSPDHLQFLLKAMYWEHCALFPRDSRGIRPFPEDAYATLTAELAWCASESVIDPIRYTAPFTTEEAVHLREQLDCLRKTTAHPDKYAEVAGRIMGVLERWRYNSLHGTQVMRRFRGQTVLPPKARSVLYRVLVPILFYAPLSHLRDCNDVYLDGILANEPEWTKHVKKLLAEWVEFVLYATILLAANLAFLSVPNTILSSGGDPSDPTDSSSSPSQREVASPAAILSYCSIFASIGSMTIGLLLIRQHRGEEMMYNARTDKHAFMEKRRSELRGFEQLSLLYSLPYVLLMWSILMFLAALVLFTQLGTDWFTRITTIVMLIIIVTMSIWCIRMGWNNSRNQDFFQYKRERWPLTPFERVTARAMKGIKAVQARRRPSEGDASPSRVPSVFSYFRSRSHSATTMEEVAAV